MMNKNNKHWPVLLLAGMTVSFFAGGCYLEIEAASHGVKSLLKGPGKFDHEQVLKAIEFQSLRIEGIQQAANTALDIAKITLGALVAVISQNLSKLISSEDHNKNT